MARIPDELKQKYHRLTLAAHPDTRTEATSGDTFAELNEGYRTLADPKRRLLHLLTLEGHSPASRPPKKCQTISPTSFSMWRSLNQRIDSVVKKQTGAASSLEKSCSHANGSKFKRGSRMSSTGCVEFTMVSSSHLRDLNERLDFWANPRALQVADIYGKITYLSTLDELEEKRVQLSVA